MTDVAGELSALRTFLAAGQNADGGWGYYAGKTSRLEPTCWGLLALGDLDPAGLTSWPSADGLLGERLGGDPNIAFHALALLTLEARRAEHRDGNARLGTALERSRGLALGDSQINRQNNKLQGWSWTAGTFSWIEPTAWALLALRKQQSRGRRVSDDRLAEAESLIVDRCCTDGGWNYGNSNMLGKELRPYVPTTGLALLALQGKSIPVATKSLAYLERAAVSESSAVALSLAVLALRAHGRPAGAPRTLLAAQANRIIELGQHLGAAMALHAMQTDTAEDAFVL
jgi:hypothetical protein